MIIFYTAASLVFSLIVRQLKQNATTSNKKRKILNTLLKRKAVSLPFRLFLLSPFNNFPLLIREQGASAMGDSLSTGSPVRVLVLFNLLLVPFSAFNSLAVLSSLRIEHNNN